MIDWESVKSATAPESAARENFQVRVSEISPNGLFSMRSFAEYMQETAFRNSTAHNLGMEALQGTQMAWVLARLALFVRHYPRKGDEVSVESWYAGFDGKFGKRFFRMFDENNMVIASGLTSFVLFDLENRKTQEWPPFIMARLPDAGECPIDFLNERLDVPEHPMHLPVFSPRLGDIDLYAHVNNTKFIEWAMASTSNWASHPFQPSAIDILFRRECCLGDEVKTSVQRLGEKGSCVLLSNQHDKELVRCQITR